MLHSVSARLPVVVVVALAATLFFGPSAASGTPDDPLDLQCDGEVGSRTPDPVDGGTRAAAQSGLDFLAADTVRWQEQNTCYGCHVQAVTMTAMAVGRHNQYSVEEKALDFVMAGLTTAPGGSRGQGGLKYAHGTYLSASKSLGGAAFARYDAWVDAEVRGDLVQTAEELLAMRDTTGAIRNDYTSPPVAAGVMQDTVLAMQTWKQAYERTADDRWLTAVAGAEGWLKRTTEAWGDAPPSDIQQINYALLGYDAAGTGATEPVVNRLTKVLLERQNADGGWSLAGGATSDAYATGQTLYALRTVGLADTDPAVAKGTSWLLEHQQADGSWSHRGAQRAEAMWGVLGLVSVDVLSLAVTGIGDGDRLDGQVPVSAEAFDNQGGRVVKVEMWVDDVALTGACGAHLATTWDTARLAPGPHIVDVKATNAAGKVARRRIEVFTGPIYLTRLASRWDDGGTLLSLRNTAPDSLGGTIRMTVQTPQGKALYTEERPATQGAMTFFWTGKDDEGSSQPEGRYTAAFAYLKGGTILHEERTSFIHANPVAQAEGYGSVGGAVAFSEGGEAANTVVQLLDEDGAVVAETRTTANGRYLFKNIDEGQYKVRVEKEGRKAEETMVQASPGAAAPQEADTLSLE